jgi:AmmeMemoRadiSam system protein A/AmmeMemoRadiSam system protein B
MSIVGAVMVPHPPLLIPEVGKGKEDAVEKTAAAYKKAAKEIARLKPETIVIISPHSVMYGDYFHISPGNEAHGSFKDFGVPEVKVDAEYDVEFVQEISYLADEDDFMAGILGERDAHLDHGTMIPLYFIQKEYKDFQVVRIGISGKSLKDHYILGQYLKEAAHNLNRRTVIAASGDLSHCLKEDGPYGFTKEGPEYDGMIMDYMKNAEFGKLLDVSESFCRQAGECGHRAFVMMAGALDRTKVTAEALSYEGPFGVGYGICFYHVQGADDKRNFKEQYEQRCLRKVKDVREKEDAYVRLARKALEGYMVKHVPIALPADVPEEMCSRRAGVFVSLKIDGQLRGCIGTICPTTASVAEEIMQNALSAGLHDSRFPEITFEELAQLEYSVDVLGEPETIESVRQLDVKKYGLILTKGTKRGLLLPNLEGVDTVEQQIAITRQKAGIREDEGHIQMQRFEVVRHR